MTSLELLLTVVIIVGAVMYHKHLSEVEKRVEKLEKTRLGEPKP